MDYFSSDKLIEPSKGDLLISEPYLPDPNFDRTVVLICEHDENGTLGYVLNKNSGVQLSEAVDEVDNSFDAELYIGGPVQKDSLHFLHRKSSRIGIRAGNFGGSILGRGVRRATF